MTETRSAAEAPPSPAGAPSPETPRPASADGGSRLSGRRVWISAAAAALSLALLLGLAGSRYTPLEITAPEAAPASGESALQRRLDRLAPTGYYAVVDSYRNRLRIYRSGELVRDAICSTGSGLVLKDSQGSREWVFDTPRGERQVVRKTRDPVWIKPDWAFVEEGFLPPENSALRRDDVSLGDYGLYLGQGYLIHGTLFKSLLGRRVTHGCIRLGDEDLEFAYQKLPVGARVFLY